MASFKWPSQGVSSAVTTINGESGDVTLVAGSGISITPSGQNITIANTSAIAAGSSFTPTITFGGGSTGLVYSNQAGFAQRIGQYLLCSINVGIANLGSSTGTVRIGGLPAASLSMDTPGSVVAFNLSGISGHLQAFVIGGGATTMRMYYLGTGSQTELDNTNFSAGVTIEISVIYQVA